MAAPFVVATGPNNAATASFSLALPSTFVGGATALEASDWIFLFVANANQPISAPANFTQVELSRGTNGSGAAGTDLAIGGQVFRAKYSDLSGPVAIPDTGDHQHAFLIAVRGADPVNPVEAANGLAIDQVNTFTGPSTTTLGAERLVIEFAANHRDIETANTQYTGTGNGNASLTTFTKLIDQARAAGTGSVMALWTGVKDAAGAVAGMSVDMASSALYNAVHFQIAIQPPQTGVGSCNVDGASHAHGAASPSLIARSALAPASAVHAHLATSPVLAASVTAAVAPANAGHGHLANSPSLSARSSVAVHNASHAHGGNAPAIVYRLLVGANDADHGQAATEPMLSARSAVSIETASHAHKAGAVTVRTFGWNAVPPAGVSWAIAPAASGLWTELSPATGNWS